jgi:hypothetical protein
MYIKPCNIWYLVDLTLSVRSTKLQNLHHAADFGLRKICVSILHYLVHIGIQKFKDKEKFIILANHFFEFHDVWVI